MSEHLTPASSRAGSGCSAKLGNTESMMFEVGHTSRQTPSVGQPLDESRDLRAANAVLDAVGAEEIDGVGDEPAALELARVRRAQQAALAGEAERLDEVLRRVADLVVVEAEAHDATGVRARRTGPAPWRRPVSPCTRSTGTIQPRAMP